MTQTHKIIPEAKMTLPCFINHLSHQNPLPLTSLFPQLSNIRIGGIKDFEFLLPFLCRGTRNVSLS
jgi:hypothetical protein